MRVFLLDKSYSGGPEYTLKARDRKYLEKVLRLEEGIAFTAKDKDENYYKATLRDGGYLFLEPTEEKEETLLDNLSGYTGEFASIDIYFSLLKGKKNESVVRALTEMGARRIVLVVSDFVQEKDLSSHQKERLETIMKEAVQQSGAAMPSLTGPVLFKDAVKMAEGTKIILHQAKIGETKYLKDVISQNNNLKKITSCFIGPEGGFSDDECLAAVKEGFTPVLLKTNVLRAETASLYIMSSLQTLLH